ncbi:hypothetical protein VNI00_008996 [Paramarasmius palmivorus]|uniref:Uncharacterized protein n=1 Tax=Paramarasmius palmivorus TaxID=297713 RepID=A0AAW0CRV2_9AGAR
MAASDSPTPIAVITEDEIPDTLATQLQKHFPIPQSMRDALLLDESASLTALSEFRTPDRIPPEAFDITAVAFFNQKCMISEENTEQLKSLLTGIRSPPAAQLDSLYERALDAKENGNHTLAIGPTSPARIPLWVLSYWFEVEEIMVAKEKWSTAEKWLKAWHKDGLMQLRGWPWKTEWLGSWVPFTEHVGRFCSDDWIGDEQMNMVGSMVQSRLDQNATFGESSSQVMNTFWVLKLVQAFRKGQNDYQINPKSYGALHNAGERVAVGSLKTIAFNAGVRLGSNGAEVVERERDANHCVTVL